MFQGVKVVKEILGNANISKLCKIAQYYDIDDITFSNWYKSVGSFLTIADAMPAEWNWQVFIRLLGLLSIMLGVMNLLPIPALDGGHIVFVIYEMITGRKPSDKFMQVAQMIGMVLILLLMLFACGNDIGRLLR